MINRLNYGGAAMSRKTYIRTDILIFSSMALPKVSQILFQAVSSLWEMFYFFPTESFSMHAYIYIYIYIYIYEIVLYRKFVYRLLL